MGHPPKPEWQTLGAAKSGTHAEHEKEKGPVAYNSLKRGLEVLGHIAQSENGLNVTEVSRLIDSDKGGASRLLSALNQMGFVRRKSVRGPFTLGTRLMELGLNALSTLDITEEAKPIIEALSREVRTMAYFAVRAEDRVILIAFFTPPNVIQIHSCLGRTFHLHSSAAGKNHLAWMSPDERKETLRRTGLSAQTKHTITSPSQIEKESIKIRQQGFAVDSEETELGVRCISAPVFDIQGQIAGSMGITGFSSILTPGRVRTLVPRIKAHAQKLSRALGHPRAEERNGNHASLRTSSRPFSGEYSLLS